MTATAPTKSDSAASQTTLALGEILAVLLSCTKVANERPGNATYRGRALDEHLSHLPDSL